MSRSSLQELSSSSAAAVASFKVAVHVIKTEVCVRSEGCATGCLVEGVAKVLDNLPD